MRIPEFKVADVRKFVPEWQGNRADPDPLVIHWRPLGYASEHVIEQARTVRLAGRDADDNPVIRVSFSTAEMERNIIRESVQRIEGLVLGDKPIKTGADLVDAITRRDVVVPAEIGDLITEIAGEVIGGSSLGPGQKKTLNALLGSSPGNAPGSTTASDATALSDPPETATGDGAAMPR